MALSLSVGLMGLATTLIGLLPTYESAGPRPFIATAIANPSGSAVLPAIYLVGVTVAALCVLIPWLPEAAGRDIHAATNSALEEDRAAEDSALEVASAVGKE